MKQWKVALNTNNIIFFISAIYIHDMHMRIFVAEISLNIQFCLYKLYLRMFQSNFENDIKCILVSVEWKTHAKWHTVGTVPKSNSNKKWRGETNLTMNKPTINLNYMVPLITVFLNKHTCKWRAQKWSNSHIHHYISNAMC